MQQDTITNSTNHKNEWQRQGIQQDINHDLIRLKQMNSAFAKINQNYFQGNQQYYSYHLQQTSNLSNYQDRQHESFPQQTEIQQNTERSNSLLFTLSEKDEDQTRPATYLNNFQYDTTRHSQYQVNNPHKFGQFQFDLNRSMSVNNTIFQHQSLHNNVFQNLNYRNINESVYEKQIIQEQQNFDPPKNQIQGFSKYEQFAIKISRLFNIQVQDLEIIYNQLKAQKDNQNQEARSQGWSQKEIQISDSEVMKKLFDYALQIKNSHHKLMNIITTIDERIQKKPQRNTNNADQGQLENVSINFMLEEQNQKQAKNRHQVMEQKDSQTKRLNRNVFDFSHQQKFKENGQNGTLQSKNTIIGKLVGGKKVDFQVPSGQSIQSSQSIVESQKTNSKSHKSKKNKRVNQKIRLISEQLESLKRQIDQEDQQQEEQSNIKKILPQKNSQQINHVVFESKKQQSKQKFQQNKKEATQLTQINKEKDLTQRNQTLKQKKPQKSRQLEPYVFGGQSFTYVKSIEQIPQDDPQIDRKIQQTIKTCILKSPSKKSLIAQQGQKEMKKQKKNLNQDKKNQKIIVELASTQNQKYSFKDKSFSTNAPVNVDVRTQNRQKMFKSIAQIRKSLSKDKKVVKNTSIPNLFKKTSNNPYLEQQQNVQKQHVEQASRYFNEEKSKQKRSSIQIESNHRQIRYFDNNYNQNERMYQRQVSTKHIVSQSGVPINQFQQIRITPPKNIYNPSKQKVHVIPYNPQPFIVQQNQQSEQKVSFSQQNIKHSFHRQPSQQKRNTVSFNGHTNLYSAKTVQSRPYIQSQKIIKRQCMNQHYLANQIFVNSPQVFNGNQKNNFAISPKNQAIYVPYNFNTNQKSFETVRISPIRNQITPRPVTPVDIIENPSYFAKNQRNCSFSTQKLGLNQNLSINLPKPIYQNQVYEMKRKDSINLLTSSNQTFVNRHNHLITTQRVPSKSIQKRQSVPNIVVTPQKRDTHKQKKMSIEKPAQNLGFMTSISAREIFQIQQVSLKKDHGERQRQLNQHQIKAQRIKNNQEMTQTFGQRPLSQVQTPYFNSNTLIQQQHQSPQYQKIPPPIQTISSALKNEQNKQSDSKLSQSLMYYGAINKMQYQKPYQEPSYLMTSRKNESVVHAFPVQVQQSQKMNNSIYAQQQFVNKIPIQQMPIYNSNVFHKEKQSSLRQSHHLSSHTPVIPNNYRPPKYIPPKESSIHDRSQSNTLHVQNQIYNKDLQQSKPLRQAMYGPGSPPVKTYTLGHLVNSSKNNHQVNQSRKSHTAINASAVKSPQEQLSDSTPSFGVFNEQYCGNSMFVNPFSKPLTNLIDSRNSSEQKRSASSRSRSSKKGIALQSKRSKSPHHKFYQSSYNS